MAAPTRESVAQMDAITRLIESVAYRRALQKGDQSYPRPEWWVDGVAPTGREERLLGTLSDDEIQTIAHTALGFAAKARAVYRIHDPGQYEAASTGLLKAFDTVLDVWLHTADVYLKACRKHGVNQHVFDIIDVGSEQGDRAPRVGRRPQAGRTPGPARRKGVWPRSRTPRDGIPGLSLIHI